MRNLYKVIDYLAFFIGLVTLQVIILSIGVYLIDHKIVIIKWYWLKLTYYFGLWYIIDTISKEVIKKYKQSNDEQI